ncbi:hypothetical protein ZIOFF_020096 [Zingiber officinale]|uniref:Uncharacterized protein n=1 Tax=Zingiber officinale TaxID=94328 RepID=A0A8J5H8C0_ZINOF|nr:hypothetical protein ZIOFF_020096 [Zingiber officinale]
MASKQYCFLFFIIALLLSSFVVAKVDVVPNEVTGEICFNERFCNVVDDCINKLTEPNYSDWLRNLKIILASEKIAYTLNKAPRKEAPVNTTPDELEKLEKGSDHNLQARCYMLVSMPNELRRWFEETVDAKDIRIHLQEMYGTQTRSVRHATVEELMTTRMRDGASIHEHGVKMIRRIEKLVNLDLVIPHELSTDIILLSLPSSFDNFVVNFNMNKLEEMASKQYCFLFFIIALLLSSFVVAKVDVVPDEVTGEVCFNDRFCNVVDDCIAVDAKDIHIHLQELYGAKTRSVRHATVKELMTAMRDEASVHEHGVKMIGLIEKSVNLDLVIPHELSTDIILLSLPSSFDNFVVNFNMNKLEATLEELVNMLANYEATMKKEKSVFLVGSSSGSKKGPKKK